MKLTMGVPGAGTHVEFDILDASADEEIALRVTQGLEALKVAGDTWKAWSLEHETDEEKQTRLLMEKNRLLNRQAIELQNVELEAMLEGKTEGIGKLPRL